MNPSPPGMHRPGANLEPGVSGVGRRVRPGNPPSRYKSLMRDWLLRHPSRRARRYAPFLVWVAWGLVAWAVGLTLTGSWGLVGEHWRIALTMLVGSYVAGSTPMGGGTVGFPVLVLVFGEPATVGRHFSFLIQSVGMTSATIFILCSGRPLAWRVLGWALVGAAATVPLASAFVVPVVSEAWTKLAFACIWGSFACLVLVRLRELEAHSGSGRLPGRPGIDPIAGLAIGVVGGLAAAITGVGIDMVLFTVLVLLYRADLRLAVATSVLAMTFASLVGTLSAAGLGRIDGEVLGQWVAAAPVVLFGAPLGALAVTLIPRRPTMLFVAALCLVQLVATVANVGPTLPVLGGVAVAMLAANGVMHLLYLGGKRLATDETPPPAGPARVSSPGDTAHSTTAGP